MRVRLYAVEGEIRRLVAASITNADGRCSEPLGDRVLLETGIYELEFGVGDYFNPAAQQPPFLGEVTIRFGVSDPHGSYHVPLLVSPYAYSTYRGS
jgi:5-hydroxyisourate hydrolase